MLFYEPTFLFVFLPVCLVVYYALPAKMRNTWVFLASCAFYAGSSLFFLPLLLGSTALDCWIGGRIFGSSDARTRKRLLTFSVLLNLGVLAFFKYCTFITSSLHVGLGAEWIPILVAPLPVGISFYTFQSMSYSIDIYRGQARPARSFADFGAFVTMFPQLIAGPIVRYQELDEQLRERRTTPDHFADGVAFFVAGLGKKLLIADTAAVFADPLFLSSDPSLTVAWVSVLLYSVQIYFDFSGYSDMAVGLGKMMGFHFPQNFNSPYRAASFSDFWRRWHMTLSHWLRDNLYVPLGGNRRGERRLYVNLLVTMTLGGLWHGASWNFVAWGAFHGLLLALERRFWPPTGRRSPLRIALTFLLVSVGWTFFRCDDMPQSITWLSAMFGLHGGVGSVGLLEWTVLATCLLLVFNTRNTWQVDLRGSRVRVAGIALCLILSLIVAYGRGSSPFLYFRF